MLDAHFVIPNLNLSSVETMTLCGRFKTHQFTVAKEVSNDGILESIDDIVQGIFPTLGTISKCPHLDQKCKLFLNEAHASLKYFSLNLLLPFLKWTQLERLSSSPLGLRMHGTRFV